MRLFNIINALATKFAPFSASTFQNVGENYNSANLIFYQGTWLTPSRFPNAAFLVALTSKYSQNKGSIYIVTTGTEDNVNNIMFNQLASNTNGPSLTRTNSGGLAVIWPSGSGITDDISIGIIGLKGAGGGYYLAPKGWWQYETIHHPIRPSQPHIHGRELDTDRTVFDSVRQRANSNYSCNGYNKWFWKYYVDVSKSLFDCPENMATRRHWWRLFRVMCAGKYYHSKCHDKGKAYKRSANQYKYCLVGYRSGLTLKGVAA